MRKWLGYVKAVDGVSLSIRQGRTLALVGESGLRQNHRWQGHSATDSRKRRCVKYRGRELVGLERKRLREMRAEFQLVFQDPYSSLNPRMRIVEIIQEGMNALNH